MAVTLSLTDLALALKVIVRVGATLEDGERELLEGLLYASTEAVDGYTDAPEPTANEAVIRMAGYLFDITPGQGRSVDAPNAFILSGARALLAPHFVPKFARVRA